MCYQCGISNGPVRSIIAEFENDAFAALESSVEQARTSVEEVDSASTNINAEIAPPLALAPTVADPPDPFPAGSKVDVFWTNPNHSGTPALSLQRVCGVERRE